LGRRFQEPQQQRVHALRYLVIVASLIAHAGEDSMSGEPNEIERYRPTGEHAKRHYGLSARSPLNGRNLKPSLMIAPSDWAASIRKIGLCLVLQIVGPGRKLNAYASIAHLRGLDEKTMKKILKFQEHTFAIAEKRNRVVHDQWLVFPSGSSHRFEATANKKLVIQYKEHPRI
jgi:hypothetical protein